VIHALATVVLGPVLLVQGRRARRRIPRLPEASGPRTAAVGSGRPLRVLVAGDSAAAGVGAATQDEALAGRIAGALQSDFRVEWRLEARTGATTADTLRRLESLPPGDFDVLVTSLGVNDVTRGLRLSDWLARQRALLGLARERFGVRLAVVAGLPPMDGFPALPQPLRWYLGRRAREFSRALERWVGTEECAHFVDLRFTLDRSLMASDGFHPGPEIYRGWGERVARIIRDAWPPDS
jgi:lysophospholipase L1-like esterase